MPPGDLTSCAGETPLCPCQHPGSVFSRETAPLVYPGSGTRLGGCRATLCSVCRHLTSSGHSGPSSRTSSPPSTSISSGETRGRGEGGGGRKLRVWGQRTAQMERPESTPLLACPHQPARARGSVLRGRSAAGAALGGAWSSCTCPAWRAITLSLPPPATLGP